MARPGRRVDWPAPRPGNPGKRWHEWTAAKPADSRNESVLAVLAQSMPLEYLRPAIAHSLRSPDSRRTALTAIRYSGDSSWIPALLDLIEHDTSATELARFASHPSTNCARLAGDVLAHIAGLRTGDRLWIAAPEESTESTGAEYASSDRSDLDHGLLWRPDSAALRRCCGAIRGLQGAAANAARLLAGRPLQAAHAQDVLVNPASSNCSVFMRCFFYAAMGRRPCTTWAILVI